MSGLSIPEPAPTGGRVPVTASRIRRFLILLIPYLWLVGGTGFIGYSHQRVLGIPVLELWMLGGVVVCSVCLAAASRGASDPIAAYVDTRLRSEES